MNRRYHYQPAREPREVEAVTVQAVSPNGTVAVMTLLLGLDEAIKLCTVAQLGACSGPVTLARAAAILASMEG